MNLNLKQVLQALGTAVLTLALYFSGFLFLLTPLPLFYLSLRVTKKLWLFSFLVVLILASLFYSSLLPRLVSPDALLDVRFTSIGYLAYYLFISFLLSLGGWRQWHLVFWGGVVCLSGMTAVFLAGFIFQNLDIFDLLGSLRNSIQEVSHMLDQVAASPTLKENRVEVLAFIAQMKEGLKFLPNLLPSLVFVFTLFTMILNLGILCLLTRNSKSLKWTGSFPHLQIPSFFVWVVIAAGSSYFLDEYTLEIGFLKIIAINLLIGVGFIYFIQGLSILAFFLKRYSLLFRFGIYGLLIVFFQMLGFVVMGLGLADTWFDFRKLHKQPIK